MSPYPILAALILCALAGFGGYRIGSDVKQGEWDASKLADSEAREESMQTAAQAIARMIPKQAKTTERVTHEVKTNTVYRECVIPDSGRRLLNDAISGIETKPAGGDGVQAASE
jgi:hypothetical protein